MRPIAFLFLLLVSPSAFAQAPSCATPRDAVSTWIDNLQADNDHPLVAITCFDFSGGPAAPTDQIRAARRLLAVLDGQGKYVVYGDIPSDPDHVHEATGLARHTLFGTLPSIYIERVGADWRVSAATVRLADSLFEDTYLLPLDRLAQDLPASLRVEVAGVAVWRLIGLLLLLLAAGVIGRLTEILVVRGLRRLLQRFTTDWDARIEERLLRWLNVLASSGLVAMLVPNLGLPVRLNLVIIAGAKIGACVAAVLIANAMVDLGCDAWSRRAAGTETRMDDQLIPLLRRASKILVAVIGVLFVLQNLDVNVGSVLAGLGLGGLAFALAAKDTLGNFFGSLVIFADQPFQIGDWVVIGSTEGTVEEVGFRSTRVRTFYDSLVTLPNGMVATAIVDNMGRRKRRRFKTQIGLTYDTTPDQMTAFVEGVRASLLASPYTRHDAFEVHFHSLGAHSLNVLVYCFFGVAAWTEELKGRQSLLLEWMRLAEELGVSFAFPTQTLHVETVAGQPRAPRAQVPSLTAMAGVVEGFGPGGDLARPQAPELTHGYWPTSQQERGSSGE